MRFLHQSINWHYDQITNHNELTSKLWNRSCIWAKIFVMEKQLLGSSRYDKFNDVVDSNNHDFSISLAFSDEKRYHFYLETSTFKDAKIAYNLITALFFLRIFMLLSFSHLNCRIPLKNHQKCLKTPYIMHIAKTYTIPIRFAIEK